MQSIHHHWGLVDMGLGPVLCRASESSESESESESLASPPTRIFNLLLDQDPNKIRYRYVTSFKASKSLISARALKRAKGPVSVVKWFLTIGESDGARVTIDVYLPRHACLYR